jgi:hypothetical protein
MHRYLKIILFGFLTWLISFVVSFAVFPLRTSQRAFFETIMAVAVTAVAVLFTVLYLRRANGHFLREGTLIGNAWFIINLLIDLPLFMLDSPMQMAFADYMMDIGLTYLIYPVVSMGCGYLLDQKAPSRAAG